MIDAIIEQYEDMGFKDLDLSEAKRLLKRFENQLEYWLNEREIAFNITQPKATNLETEKTDGGIIVNTNDIYLINVEKIDRKISVLKKRTKNLMIYIENEMKIIGEYNPIEAKIIMLRDDESKKWREIAETTGYCERQVIRIYNKYIDKKRKDVKPMS